MYTQEKHSLRVFTRIFLSLILLWFLLFKWHIIPYPYNSDFPPRICYSPNHEYFIKRFQTPIQALLFQLEPRGIAILYDKSGKKLHKGKTDLDRSYGPLWFASEKEPAVFFEGLGNFYADLPSSPGEHPERGRGCF